jgi:hypothetical protein
LSPNTTSASTPRNRGGRPPKDYSYLVNQDVNGVRILNVYLPRGGQRMAQIECPYCKKPADKILQNVLSGRTTSCGCHKRDLFRDYHNRQADKLSGRDIADIWSARMAGESRKAVAKRFELQKATVDEAFRRYQLKVDSMQESLSSGVPLSELIQNNDLGEQAIAYLRKVSIRLARQKAEEAVERAEEAEEIAWKARLALDEIRSDWEDRRGRIIPDELKRYQRPRLEMTEDELRRRNGRIVGSLSGLYFRCLDIRGKVLDEAHKKTIMEFIELAEDTLRARTERSGDFLRDSWKQCSLPSAA